MIFSNLKYLFTLLIVLSVIQVSAQKVVMKYDAGMIVQKKEISGILIQSVTDSSNRFIFVSKLGLKFFDMEVGKKDFNYIIHYFSPVFKTEKRMLGVAKEMFVLGFNDEPARKKGSKVRYVKSKNGSCKSGFGLFGKRVRVCYLDSHTSVQCKCYPISFHLRTIH